MSRRLRSASGLALLCLLLAAAVARADRLDDLTRALMQDSSYKVRVQAALVLGKLKDRRAVPALLQALKDENETVRGVSAASLAAIGDPAAQAALTALQSDGSEFVRNQAKRALATLNGGGGGVAVRPGARFYIAVGFRGGKGPPQNDALVREALQRELLKLSDVTLSVGGGEPSESQLSQKRLQGFLVDGTVQRLSAKPAGGATQIDCDLKAFVATFPGKSIKMMTTEGASLQTGSGPSETEEGKRDCIAAAVEAVREDVGKFLRTQQ